MASQKQIESARRNGALFETPEGKSRSAQNSLHHGLLAKTVVLSIEDRGNFEILLGQYMDKFQPRDGVEINAIEEMAASYWRLRRAFAMERQQFEAALENHPDGDDLERLGNTWNEVADSPRLLTLHRYQSMLHRMHQRALNSLFKMRELDPENMELRNEPKSAPEAASTPPPAAPDPQLTPPNPAPAAPAHSQPSPLTNQPGLINPEQPQNGYRDEVSPPRRSPF